jgi:hypothetical protein
MKRIFITIVVPLTLAVLTMPPVVTRVASAQTEVALLDQPEGDVWLKRGRRRPQRVRAEMLLNVGDVVSVNGNGTVVIYQAYVPVTRLGANERFKVVRRTPPPLPRGLRSDEFTSLVVIYYRTSRSNRQKPSPVTMGGSEDARLTLLEPRNSVALERRPAFNWSRVSDATKYVLNVYKVAGKEETVVCTETTAETRLTLPDKCQPLDPGGYKWEVTAQIGDRVSDDPALYDATTFTIVSPKRAAAIIEARAHARYVAENGSAEAVAVYASALMKAKLYPEAEVELRKALERSPKDQALWALLIETYAQIKRWRARDKARDISAGDPTAELIRSLMVAR